MEFKREYYPLLETDRPDRGKDRESKTGCEVCQGRLGTYQLLLHLYLPENMTAKSCNEYTRSLNPAVDIGVYPPEFHMEENVVFVNAYNLKDGEETTVADVVCDYILGH